MVDTVIRQVTPLVHTFSRPFSRFGLLKIGARSTVLVLSDGSLVIISPISLKEDRQPLAYVREHLGGRVKLLIAPDLAHWLSVHEWSKAFPAAKVVGVEGHDQKTRGSGLIWNVLFSSSTNVTHVLEEFGLSGELDFCYFAGFVGKDLVTLHLASRTIIEADLIFNLPAKEQYAGKTPKGLTTVMNVLRADSVWSRRFLKYVGTKNKDQMCTAARTVSNWDFENLIPCHGDIVLHDAKRVWDWTFDWFLH